MDEKLKQLTQELGQAIDQAINDAAKIKELTEQLRTAGYETILMVEATICFAKRPQENEKPLDELGNPQDFSELISSDDRQFLKKLNISLENMDE